MVELLPGAFSTVGTKPAGTVDRFTSTDHVPEQKPTLLKNW